MSRTSRVSAWICWITAQFLSALLATLILRWQADARPLAILLGWVLTGGLAATSYLFLPLAIGQDTTRFLLLGLGSQLLHLGVLMTCFAALSWQAEKTSFLGFVSSSLVGYFTHLFAEVAWLARWRTEAPVKT